MKLRHIEKQLIHISQLIGYDENNEPIYTPPIMTKAQISQNIKGEVVTSPNGVSEVYDLRLTVEFNDINKYINEHTRFWIYTSATEQDYNYVVLKRGQWYNGVNNIFVKSVEQNWSSIWTYSKAYGFYEVQAFLDEDNLLLKIPQDSYFNVDINKKIWREKPENENQKEGLYLIDDQFVQGTYNVYKLISGEE